MKTAIEILEKQIEENLEEFNKLSKENKISYITSYSLGYSNGQLYKMIEKIRNSNSENKEIVTPVKQIELLNYVFLIQSLFTLDTEPKEDVPRYVVQSINEEHLRYMDSERNFITASIGAYYEPKYLSRGYHTFGGEFIIETRMKDTATKLRDIGACQELIRDFTKLKGKE